MSPYCSLSELYRFSAKLRARAFLSVVVVVNNGGLLLCYDRKNGTCQKQTSDGGGNGFLDDFKPKKDTSKKKNCVFLSDLLENCKINCQFMFLTVRDNALSRRHHHHHQNFRILSSFCILKLFWTLPVHFWFFCTTHADYYSIHLVDTAAAAAEHRPHFVTFIFILFSISIFLGLKSAGCNAAPTKYANKEKNN